MKTLSVLLGVAGFIAVCAWCFNYVEGHKSTAQKEKIVAYSGAIADLSNENEMLQGKLRQACTLLEEAEVENVLCEEQPEATPLERLLSSEEAEAEVEVEVEEES